MTVFLVIAIFCSIYYITLQIYSYHSLFDFLIGLKSFSSIWLFISLIFYALYFLEKNGNFKRFIKRMRITITILSAGFAFFCLPLLIKILTPKTTETIPSVKYVILFGGGINRDGSLTKSPKNRVKKCAYLMNTNPDLICIASGAKPIHGLYPEGKSLKNELCKLGIAEDRIIEEDYAKDTIENLKFGAELIAKAEGKTLEQVLDMPLALVSNTYHLSRIEQIAKRLGFKKVYCIKAKVPQLYILDSYLREIFAHIKLTLRLLVTKKPSKISNLDQ